MNLGGASEASEGEREQAIHCKSNVTLAAFVSPRKTLSADRQIGARKVRMVNLNVTRDARDV